MKVNLENEIIVFEKVETYCTAENFAAALKLHKIVELRQFNAEEEIFWRTETSLCENPRR